MEKANRQDPFKLDYDVIRVRSDPGEYYEACARAAVLYQLYPAPPGLAHDSHDFIRDKMLELIHLRRLRLMALRDLGHPLFVKNYAWYVNCPPFGVYTNKQSRVCRLSQFCPFCWARDFIKPTITQALALYRGKPPLPGTKPADALSQAVESGGPRILLYATQLPLEPGETLRDRLVQEALRVQVGRRKFTAKKQQHLGSVMLTSARPEDSGWTIHRRRLTLVGLGRYERGSIDVLPDPDFVTSPPEAIYCAQTGDLLGAVAKTLCYPTWLLQGDVDRVAEWFEARQRLRLIGKCGALRGAG